MKFDIKVDDDKKVSGGNLECSVAELLVVTVALGALWKNPDANLIDRCLAGGMADTIRNETKRLEEKNDT